MKNFVQPGGRMTITAGADLTSGQGLIVGATFGVVAESVLNGEETELAIEGVYSLPKEPALAIGQGVKVYWDAGNARVTTTVGANTPIGKSHAAALAADAEVLVKLIPGANMP